MSSPSSSPSPEQMAVYERRNQEAIEYFKIHPEPPKMTEEQMETVRSAIQAVQQPSTLRPEPFEDYPPV